MQPIGAKILTAACALVFFSCGGSDGGSSSGVSAGALLNDVSNAEREKLCRWEISLDWADPTPRDECNYVVLHSSRDQQECERERGRCAKPPNAAPTSEPDETREGRQPCEQALVGKAHERCDVTVEEYEACMLALASADRARYDEGCDNAEQYWNESESTLHTPKACWVMERCEPIANQLWF